jgi:hypothetical protein
MVITINSVSEQFDGLYRNKKFQAASDLLDQLDFTELSDQDLITYVTASRRYLFRLLVWSRVTTSYWLETIRGWLCIYNSYIWSNSSDYFYFALFIYFGGIAL